MLSVNTKDLPRECYGWRTNYKGKEEGFVCSCPNLAVNAGVAPFLLTESVTAASHLLPDSFEEQMMLAMAVSLAEFQSTTTDYPGITWLQ